MKGLDLSRAFFETYGKPMLKKEFPDLLPFIAAGLCGSGSECFGYDDPVSTDHDFEPGFCLFLPGEEIIDRKAAFQLERAYAKLPKEFEGYKRSVMQPVGGARHGVLRAAEFFTEKTGTPDGILSSGQWLHLPESALAEAVNGELFFDEYGLVSTIRKRLSYYPEEIRKKKLAGNLLLMAQAGQYNYLRCIRHGETAAAQMSVFEFVKSGISVIFLLNQTYQPYYKWSFHALRELPKLSLLAELFEYLISSDNEEGQAEEKYDVIEGIAADIIDELIEQELTKANCGDLEKHAYSVNDGIEDSNLRNLHILEGV
ncbi:MAG: DUF4037 domain-containing protein [Parasporobacterium sp.]|nr:DUF4037 domain-containing protein [Parasporobacterium sp.]